MYASDSWKMTRPRHARLRPALFALLQSLRGGQPDHELRSGDLRSGARRRSLQRTARGAGNQLLQGCRLPRRNGRTEPVADAAGLEQRRAARRHRLGHQRRREVGHPRGRGAVLPARAPQSRAEHRRESAVRQEHQRPPHARHERGALRRLLRHGHGAPELGPRAGREDAEQLAVEPVVSAGDLPAHDVGHRLRGQQGRRPAHERRYQRGHCLATSMATASTTASSTRRLPAARRPTCGPTVSATTGSRSGSTPAIRCITRCRRRSSAAGARRSSRRRTRCRARVPTSRSTTALAVWTPTRRGSTSRTRPPTRAMRIPIVATCSTRRSSWQVQRWKGEHGAKAWLLGGWEVGTHRAGRVRSGNHRLHRRAARI